MSQSKLSLTTKRAKQQKYTKDYKRKIWEEMECTYIKEGMLTISDIKRQRESIVDNLN